MEKEETGSTNDDARELALSGAPHGSAVLAARQTRGRGRAGRAWASPDGGLYLSLVVRPTAPAHKWSLFPLAAGVAVATELRVDGTNVDIKWPNDLLLDGRKVGGILVESRAGASPFVIVGLGLNLGAPPRELPDAAALRTGEERRALAQRLAGAILAHLDALQRNGPTATLAGARALCVTLGRRVKAEKVEGRAVDVAEDGALLVEDDAGVRRAVVAGDVRVVAME